MNIVAYSYRFRGRILTKVGLMVREGSDKLLDWPSVQGADGVTLAVNPKLAVIRPAAPWERIAYAWGSNA